VTALLRDPWLHGGEGLLVLSAKILSRFQSFWYCLTPDVPHDGVLGAPALRWYGAPE